MIQFFMDKMKENPENQAILSSKFSLTCGQLLDLTKKFSIWLNTKEIPSGAVVSFDGDYSPESLALFLSLIPI